MAIWIYLYIYKFSFSGIIGIYDLFLQATFECLLKTYGFLTPEFWKETRFTKSPFQEHTDLLMKPTGKLHLEAPLEWCFLVFFFAKDNLWFALFFICNVLTLSFELLFWIGYASLWDKDYFFDLVSLWDSCLNGLLCSMPVFQCLNVCLEVKIPSGFYHLLG